MRKIWKKKRWMRHISICLTENMEKSDAWKRQRVLKKEDIPSQSWVTNTAKRFPNIQERSLFIIAYLTAGRITEIVQRPYLLKRVYKYIDTLDKQGNPVRRVARNPNGSPLIFETVKSELNYKGILKRDISFEFRKGKNIMLVRMQNRKNRLLTRKNPPIPVDREGPLVDMLKEYLDMIADDTPLFDFKISKAEQIINKVGMNPHFIRDIRLTHMVQIYDFNPFELAKFAGWKNASPAERYVRLSTKDLEAKY